MYDLQEKVFSLMVSFVSYCIVLLYCLSACTLLFDVLIACMLA